tara:strand:- start:171 stop:386 length:216 start_codon:yes stop_codon:yes gene_type:complete
MKSKPKPKPKVKKKLQKNIRGEWDTRELYQSKNPFNIDWVKFHNPREGRDMIIFLYSDKHSKKIVKHRILR